MPITGRVALFGPLSHPYGQTSRLSVFIAMSDQLYDLTLTGLAYGGDALGRLSYQWRIPTGWCSSHSVSRASACASVLSKRSAALHAANCCRCSKPSPDRIEPRCKHFGVCGGCHYQHMPYETQLKAKTDILRDQLRRIGHIPEPPVEPAVPSPDPYYYRNQVQFHLRQDGKLGYVARRSRA